MGYIRKIIAGAINKTEEVLFSLLHKKTSVIIRDVDYGTILQGKRAIVIGGNSGIGLAIATKMANSGCNVVIVGRNPEKTIKVAQDLECEHLVIDITDTEDLIAQLSKYADVNNIDILVNSAGVLDKEPWLEKTPEGFDLVLNTNLKSIYFACQTIAKHMIEKKIEGHILNVSSSSSMRPSWGPYQLSKRALNGLTLGFAQKLAPHGITVNGIAPGVTLTPMASQFMDVNNLAYYNPLRRAETPEEIANLAIFLVSDLGASIVGDTVMITGGSGILSDYY